MLRKIRKFSIAAFIGGIIGFGVGETSAKVNTVYSLKVPKTHGQIVHRYIIVNVPRYVCENHVVSCVSK
jgi:hypothetical protein